METHQQQSAIQGADRTKVENNGPKTESAVERIVDPRALRDKIEAHRKLGGKIILEVGFGGKFSVNLGQNDLSVGVDPGVAEIDTKKLNADYGAERVLFDEKTAALQQVFLEEMSPDVIVMVAPAPSDVKSMLMDLKPVCKPGKIQFLILFENESLQAEEGETEEIASKATAWLENKMKLEVEYNDEISEDPDQLSGQFDELLQNVGLPGGVLKSKQFGKGGSWIAVTGTRRK